MRPEGSIEKHNFINHLNIGYERFSKETPLGKMHPVVGNKGEYLFLALFFPFILLVRAARFKNEDGVRDALGHANNRYAHFTTVGPSTLA